MSMPQTPAPGSTFAPGHMIYSVSMLIYPVPAQGAEALPATIEALWSAHTSHAGDLLILARNAGSPEAPWTFNDEVVTVAVWADPGSRGKGVNTRPGTGHLDCRVKAMHRRPLLSQ